jgi:SAM-dependent methyltransferase
MQWFENESFWESFFPSMFSPQRVAAAPAQVEQVIALSGVQAGTVVDLCCGPGRHGAVLAEKGFAVTAVDRSPFLLDKARAHAAHLQIEFVQADMQDFIRPGSFDLGISLFTSFGYFETPDQDLAVLRNVRSSLKSGGVFLMDILGKECLASRSHTAHWEQLADGKIFVEHAEVLSGWSRIRNNWMLVEGERAQRFEFEINVYSGQELVGMLKEAGFGSVDLFGSLDGAPYNSVATRLVARARR